MNIKYYFLGIFFLSFLLSLPKESFSIKTITNNQIEIQFELKDYEIEDMKNFNQDLLESQNLSEFSTLISLDYNQTYTIDFILESKKSYNLENDFNDYYNSDSIYLINEHIFRGNKLLELTVNPLYKDAENNRISVIEKASFHINLNIDSEFQTNPRRPSKIFSDITKDITLNSRDADENRNFEYQSPSALYICDPDIEDNPYLQALINWRKQQGYEVTLVSTNITGNSTASIQNYIEDAYYSWTNPPEYLCLIGDADGSVSIPTFNVSDGGGGWNGAYGESDYPYTLIEGDDLYPEMLVGRISVRTSTELATVINKIIGYEKAYAGTENWLSSTALVGDPYNSGISTVITNQYIEQLMENYGVENINTQYSGSNFDAFMRDQINSGIAYLNYRGFYGFSNFNVSDVDQLNNGYKLPFISTLTCGVNSFWSDTESIAEALLRAGSPANPSGAVAVVGTSQSFTHTAFNNIVSMGIFEGIYLHEAQTAGSALLYGKLALMNTYPQDPNGNVMLFSSWNNLMGDPLTHLWTNTPIQLIVEHESIISSNSNYFSVSVMDFEGRPLNNAIVTLYKTDEHSINSTTNEFGIANFNLNYQDIGNILVTSRCHNCVPEETSFEITNSFPEVNLIEESISVDDSLDGNLDGYANPGESVYLNIALQNQSSDLLSDCSFNVLSNNSELQIINGVSDIGFFNPNTNVNIDNISFLVNNVAEYYENNLFILAGNLSCDDLSWDFSIPIVINYGNLSITLELISDQNNNMILDPGETGDFAIVLDNNGYIDLHDIDLSFNYQGNYIDILDQYIYVDELMLGGSNNINIISIVGASNVINGSIITLPITALSSNGYEASLNANIQVGYTTLSDPLGPDQYGYYIYGQEDTQYQWAPTYDWIEIDPDYGGDGIELSIYDGGNNQDDAQSFDLPFTFTFYGQDYNEITICSNGWISLGETDMTSFRNYHLPGPGGPSPMIAVFWDDLKTTNGGEIYWYYDSVEDYLVVEWSNMRTYTDNDLETFQAILYNSNNLTPTGDDEIKLQYKEFNNTSEGFYPVGNYEGAVVHGQYSSIGTENLYGTVGLEYTFNDEYPVAASPLSNESALFITTRIPQIFSQASLSLSDNEFDIDLDINEEINFTLTVTNDGEVGSVLNYDIMLSPFNDLHSNVDDAGYAWLSSSLSDEVVYAWEEVSENSLLLSFNQNDQASDPLSIGFLFPFYGEEYNELIVNPNGWIGFGEDNNGWNNQPIFSEDSPTNAIFAFWDDLNPISSLDNEVGLGNVFIDSSSERCIVWYDHVTHWTDLNRIYDFQLILYPDGLIKVNYREMIGDTDSATIGIVNQDGEIGQQITYNDSFVENELSVEFKGTPSWINYYQLDTNDTSLSSGEYNLYSIDINSYNLIGSTYSASLLINPEDSFMQTIPINLTVTAPEIVLGDVNFDQIINILDVISMINFIIESSFPTLIELEASDINQDNILDILDIVMVLNIILSE